RAPSSDARRGASDWATTRFTPTGLSTVIALIQNPPLLGKPRAELVHLLVEGRAAAVGHGGLLGEAGVELDEERPLAGEDARQVLAELGECADGEGLPVPGALRHHYVVDALAPH